MKICESDHDERLLIYSSMALDFQIYGGEYLRKGDEENASKFYAISWAYHNLQEFNVGIELCDKLLNKMGFFGEELYELHEYGKKMAKYGEDLAVTVSEIFGHDNPFKQNLPKDIF